MTDTMDADIEEGPVQPALPELDLPDYNGRRPVGMKTAVNGAGNRVYRPHTIGDTVTLVIEAKVSDAGHKQTKDGLLYVEKYQVADVFEADGETGKHLLLGLRTAYRLADDERHGRKQLPLAGMPPILGPDGWTDGSGRLLLPEELAEIRGELAAREGGDGDEAGPDDGDVGGDLDALAELEAGRGRTIGEPWPGYEQSSAKEIRDHLGGMDDRDEVFGVAAWEEAHGGRKTIVEAATRRAAELLDGGE